MPKIIYSDLYIKEATKGGKLDLQKYSTALKKTTKETVDAIKDRIDKELQTKKTGPER